MELSDSTLRNSRQLHGKRGSLAFPYGDSMRTSNPTAVLVNTIQSALETSLVDLPTICGRNTGPRVNEKSLKEMKEELEYAMSAFQQDLTHLLHDLGTRQIRMSGSHDGLSTIRFDDDVLEPTRWNHFRIAFYMTALLDLARDVVHLLRIEMDLSTQVGEKKKWHFPSVPGLSRLRKRTGSPPTMAEDGGKIGRLLLNGVWINEQTMIRSNRRVTVKTALLLIRWILRLQLCSGHIRPQIGRRICEIGQCHLGGEYGIIME